MAEIAFFLGDTQGCGFHRCAIPAKHLLRKNQHNISLLNVYSENILEWGDLFILQRQYTAGLLERLPKYRRKGKKFIYDLDDDIYNMPSWNPASYLTKDEELEISRNFLKRVDGVSTTTKFLRDSLQEMTSCPVEILPNSLDFEFVDGPVIDPLIIAGKDFVPLTLSQEQIRKEKEDGFIYIMWFGGFSHYKDVKIILEALFQICSEYENVILYIMAFCLEELLNKFDWKRLRPIPAAHLFDYMRTMKSLHLDIGLAPLADVLFNRSKSNLKVIEYLALGIPPLSTNSDPYSETLKAFDPSLLVEKEEDWYDKLKWLIENKQKRDEVAVKGRPFVEENYNMAKNIHLWENFYEKILSS